MAGKNDALMIAGAIILAVFLLGQQNNNQIPGTPSNDQGGSNIDLCKLVDGQASFTGQNKYLSGTALTGDFVRVIKMNGDIKKDLGQISMNSGTLATSPGAVYKLYFGENTSSATRYASLESYTAPCQDSTDDKVGLLCTVDTAPSITVFDENGQVQSATANAQAIGASETVDVQIKIKAAADSCYGNPESPKKNAICLDYNSTVIKSIKSNTPSSVIPYSISNAKAASTAETCFEFDTLADTESQLLTITLEAQSTQPTVEHNMTISLEDIDFDLNQDTLAEIWGFEDESNNNLGQTSAVTGTIYVS